LIGPDLPDAVGQPVYTRGENAPACKILIIRWSGGEQCAKSAVSTLSYPELPLPGYGLVLIPPVKRGIGKHLGSQCLRYGLPGSATEKLLSHQVTFAPGLNGSDRLGPRRIVTAGETVKCNCRTLAFAANYPRSDSDKYSGVMWSGRCLVENLS
jgi:hypothetical protein